MWLSGYAVVSNDAAIKVMMTCTMDKAHHQAIAHSA
jgi:hypothetical protein